MGMTHLLTVEETAALLKVSKQQVRKMIRGGLLPALKVGREWRITEAFMQAFIKENITY